VLFGCVWAITQMAESSSTENSMAFIFMVSRLRYVSFITNSRRESPAWESGGISSRMVAFRYSEIAGGKEKLQARVAAARNFSDASSAANR
jgi:hypothetical protein